MLKKICLFLISISMALFIFLAYIFVYLPGRYQIPTDSLSNIQLSYPNIEMHKDNPMISRGETLVKIGNCLSCHTPDSGEAFAGGKWIETPYGRLPSTNITFDPVTGIGKWRLDDFKQAMTKGISPKNTHYFPAFPYPYFAQLNEDDLQAIYAYLSVIPKVYRENSKPEFPYNLWGARWSMKIWNYFALPLTFPKSTLPGKVYVDALGHCGACHTPANLLSMPKQDYYLGGQFIAGYYAPNLSKIGLQHASANQLYHSLKDGKLLFGAGNYVGPMAEVYRNSLSSLPKGVLKDIAIYLKTVKSKPLLEANLSGIESNDHYVKGAAIYQQVCAFCHQNGKMGATLLGNKARWLFRLKSQGLENLYQRSIDGFNRMPIQGGCVNCSNDDVKDAVDYLLSRSIGYKNWQHYKRIHTEQKQM